jgi:hypothetical protein
MLCWLDRTVRPGCGAIVNPRWKVINDYFEDDHCRTFMLWLAFMTIQPVDRPYTGRLAYAIANGRQYNSWATPVGGSGMLPKALTCLDRGSRRCSAAQQAGNAIGDPEWAMCRC